MTRKTVMSLEAIRDQLKSLPTMTPVMMSTGIHVNNLYAIANGKALSVNYSTLIKLNDYLEGLAK